MWERLLLLFTLTALSVCRGGEAVANAHARWEKDIAAFEAEDRANPPPAKAILFVGSSSIRLWQSLAEDFEGIRVIRRGFGGSEMADCLFFADRIVLPYRPKQIVVYAGENDLAAGHSPERVVRDFKALVEKVHAALPQTRVAYISMKPSPSRWHLADEMRQGNGEIAAYTRSDERLSFIDVFAPMLGPDGRPRQELFVSDKLHLNRTGYALWTERIRPYLID